MRNPIWLGFVLLAFASCGLNAAEAKPGIKTENKPAEAPKPATPASAVDPSKFTPDQCEEAGLCAHCKKPSKPVYHVEWNGKTYHFCCRNAQQEYKADPAKYLGPAK